VALNRALSKLGIMSRSRAAAAIRDGRVSVNGRVVRRPDAPVVPEQVRIEVDGTARAKARWRTVALHKPRGVVTTRHDPRGRRTVFDLLGEQADAMVAVGRLDLATTGLLLLTTDTRLAHRLTDPANQIPRVYVVTVRGEVTDDQMDMLRAGVMSEGERLTPGSVTVRKRSRRESHLVLELREGKNREVRRLFEAIGHEVTRLARVKFGRLELGDLRPGEWRELTRADIRRAFDGYRDTIQTG
jgi:23S rRNA pseudouridine2605 synthase